jgi:hypothetical protein
MRQQEKIVETDNMQITQDHIDFVAICIASGEPEGADCVRVDVLAIGERFGVTWQVARNILQASTHALGHRMAGPRSSVVRKVQTPPETPPKSRFDIMLAATTDLMANYASETASILRK